MAGKQFALQVSTEAEMNAAVNSLTAKGFTYSGDIPSEFKKNLDDTVLYVPSPKKGGKVITFGSIDKCKKKHKDYPIVEFDTYALISGLDVPKQINATLASGKTAIIDPEKGTITIGEETLTFGDVQVLATMTDDDHDDDDQDDDDDDDDDY